MDRIYSRRNIGRAIVLETALGNFAFALILSRFQRPGCRRILRLRAIRVLPVYVNAGVARMV